MIKLEAIQQVSAADYRPCVLVLLPFRMVGFQTLIHFSELTRTFTAILWQNLITREAVSNH